jgi:hypothetical protein
MLRFLDASREMRGTEPSSIVNRRDSTGSTDDQSISIARSVPSPIAPELPVGGAHDVLSSLRVFLAGGNSVGVFAFVFVVSFAAGLRFLEASVTADIRE